MSDCPQTPQLRELLDEKGDPGVICHVDDCPVCQQKLESLIDEGTFLRYALPAQTNPTLRESSLNVLMNRLRRPPPRLTMLLGTGSNDDYADIPRCKRPEPFPELLASYQIQERIGGGGCGVLYKALDTKLNRIVAIKVLKEELAVLKSERSRLQREAQLAASLKHEHIVTVYDVSTTPDPFPFMVMEYVEGESLGQRLQREGVFDIREAVQLVQQVARGLSAAHAKGLVHRDIKPSNIMFERKTGRAKITDFGLARAIDPGLHFSGEVTLAGTPSYMSSEQILFPGTVDGRSDIYSLGIVLYELLTGEVPFRGVLRMILYQVLQDEPRPPRRLNDKIPRDLENICLKAIRKDANHRYQSAKEFLDDLTRWLEGRPVGARPISRWGKFVMWAKRNPVMASLTGLVVMTVASLIVGLASANVLLQDANDREQSARAAANRNAVTAGQQRDLALESLQTLIFEVQDQLEDKPGMSGLRQSLLDTALQGLEKVADSVESSELADQSTLAGLLRLGDVFLSAGKVEQAMRQYQVAAQMSDRLLEDDPDNARFVHLAVLAQWKQGDVYLQQDRTTKATTHYVYAYSLCEEKWESKPGPSTRHDLAIALVRLGDAKAREGNYQEAYSLYGRGLTLIREMNESGSPSQSLMVAQLKAGETALKLNRLEEAATELEAGHRSCQQLAQQTPDDRPLRRRLAIAESRLGELRLRQDRPQDALSRFQSSHCILHQLSNEDPRNQRLQHELAIVFCDLGRTFLVLGRVDPARDRFRQSLRMIESRTRGETPNHVNRKELFLCWKGLATVELVAGRPKDAQSWLNRARDYLNEPQILNKPITKLRLEQKEIEDLENQIRELP